MAYWGRSSLLLLQRPQGSLCSTEEAEALCCMQLGVVGPLSRGEKCW